MSSNIGSIDVFIFNNKNLLLISLILPFIHEFISILFIKSSFILKLSFFSFSISKLYNFTNNKTEFSLIVLLLSLFLEYLIIFLIISNLSLISSNGKSKSISNLYSIHPKFLSIYSNIILFLSSLLILLYFPNSNAIPFIKL